MSKLSYKERQNLCEKISMDKQEREEWENGLRVRITPDRKGGIECIRENVRFVEGDNLNTKHEQMVRDFFQRIANEEANERIRLQNKKINGKRACVKCGEMTPVKHVQIENNLAYCPYCWEVCFGKANKNWLPGFKEGEAGKGFHKA